MVAPTSCRPSQLPLLLVAAPPSSHPLKRPPLPETTSSCRRRLQRMPPRWAPPPLDAAAPSRPPRSPPPHQAIELFGCRSNSPPLQRATPSTAAPGHRSSWPPPSLVTTSLGCCPRWPPPPLRAASADPCSHCSARWPGGAGVAFFDVVRRPWGRILARKESKVLEAREMGALPWARGEWGDDLRGNELLPARRTHPSDYCPPCPCPIVCTPQLVPLAKVSPFSGDNKTAPDAPLIPTAILPASVTYHASSGAPLSSWQGRTSRLFLSWATGSESHASLSYHAPPLIQPCVPSYNYDIPVSKHPSSAGIAAGESQAALAAAAAGAIIPVASLCAVINGYLDACSWTGYCKMERGSRNPHPSNIF